MRLIFCLVLALFFTSCATILNSKHTPTTIVSHQPSTVIVDNDTLRFDQDNQIKTIAFERSRGYRQIVVIREAAIDTVVLRPQWSTAYWLNFYNWGIGFAIDGKTPKKWGNPKAISLTDKYIRKHSPNNIYNFYARKGVANLRISLPWASLFNYSYEHHGRKSRGGFIGLSLGADYFFNDNMFLNVSGTWIMDIFIPFPTAVDFGGIWDHMFSLYGSVSNNHMLFGRRFSIGYGISYGRDVWNTINHGRWNDDDPEEYVTQESVYRHSNSIGLVLPAYYYSKQSFYMGFVYRPMLLQHTNKTRFKYQHTISFDFGWRIRLNPNR